MICLPFTIRGNTIKPNGNFEYIDRRMMRDVIPLLNWDYAPSPNTVTILPNGFHVVACERGPARSHDPQKYLAVMCEKAGLSYEEIGLWLDTCLEAFEIRNSDGKKRRMTTEPESLLRFDRRKYIYRFNEQPCRYLHCVEID